MSVSCFSQSPSSGEGELVLLEHRDHLKALRGRLQVLACALDVLATDQRLDRLGARGRGAEAAFIASRSSSSSISLPAVSIAERSVASV